METLQMNITMEQNSSLLTIMTILNQIKDRNLDDKFDHLQDIINLLKNYNVDLDDSIGIQVKTKKYSVSGSTLRKLSD